MKGHLSITLNTESEGSLTADVATARPGQTVTLTDTVVFHNLKEGNTYTLRVNITKTRWGYDDTILVYYEAQEGDSRILEDDIVTMYGMLGGTYTYKTVMGNSLTVPLLYAKYISIE